MFPFILTYILGVGTGAGLLIANSRIVAKAVSEEKAQSQKTIDSLKRENQQIWQERNELLREREWNQAYYEGRKSPLSDVEKFANTLERHRAKFVSSSNDSK